MKPNSQSIPQLNQVPVTSHVVAQVKRAVPEKQQARKGENLQKRA